MRRQVPDSPGFGRDARTMSDAMTARPRVVVADDHPAMLQALVRSLSDELEVVAAVADGNAAVIAVAQHTPDVVVLDIAMPGLNGIAAAARIRDGGSRATLVFVTNLDDPELVESALALGPIGFVLKNRLVADLLPAVRSVFGGHTFLSPPLRSS